MAEGELERLGEQEVAAIPIDPETGLVLAIGENLNEGGDLVPKGFLDAVLDAGGFAGGAFASKALLDGSLVRLSPQTVRRMKEGAVFLKDEQGLALGSLYEEGKRGVTDAVRFLPGPSNPVAAGLMLQTMAVQRKLGQIERALEAVDQKLETVLRGVRHGKLATLHKLSSAIDELSHKLRDGHQLTEVDETKLRDYRDEAKQLEAESRQWLHDLRRMLAQQDISLREQHETLSRLIREEHVAFWLRIYIAAEAALAHSTWLLLARTSTTEPAWAEGLKSQADAQLQQAATDIAGLMSDLDNYLRDPDIASGWEELSLKRKRDVRALRRQLLGVHAGLRDGLEATSGSITAMLGHELELPGQLSRRDVDPWLIRDGVADGTKKGWTATREGAAQARHRAITGGSRLFERLEERYATDGEDGRDDDPSEDATS